MDNVIYFNSMSQPKGGVCSVPVIIMFLVLLALLILVAVLTYGLIDSIKNTTLTLTGKELIIKSTFYGKKIPLENIRINEIQNINLNENQNYSISYRRNGIRLPNVSLGWMTLKNKQKVLAFITDKTNVVVIPAKDFVVLFSMTGGDEFIEKIKAAGNGTMSR